MNREVQGFGVLGASCSFFFFFGGGGGLWEIIFCCWERGDYFFDVGSVSDVLLKDVFLEHTGSSCLRCWVLAGLSGC